MIGYRTHIDNAVGLGSAQPWNGSEDMLELLMSDFLAPRIQQPAFAQHTRSWRAIRWSKRCNTQRRDIAMTRPHGCFDILASTNSSQGPKRRVQWSTASLNSTTGPNIRTAFENESLRMTSQIFHGLGFYWARQCGMNVVREPQDDDILSINASEEEKTEKLEKIGYSGSPEQSCTRPLRPRRTDISILRLHRLRAPCHQPLPQRPNPTVPSQPQRPTPKSQRCKSHEPTNTPSTKYSSPSSPPGQPPTDAARSRISQSASSSKACSPSLQMSRKPLATRPSPRPSTPSCAP
jgi:hypothetical protein